MRKARLIGILASILLAGCADAETATRPSRVAPRTLAAASTAGTKRPPSNTAKAASRAGAPSPKPNLDHTVLLPHCLVSLIYQAEVPAEEAGVLLEILIREGDQVSPHDLLAKIDDTHARMQLDVAEYKLAVAKETAENDVHIRYSKAAAQVAYAEYLQAVDANKKFAGTVTQAEIRRLLLTHQRAVLEIEQAQINQRIAQKELQVSEAELAAAKEGVNRRLIKAPMMSPPQVDEHGKVVLDKSGAPVPRDDVKAEVVQLHLHAGEWVKPGDPVLYLVRMDRLRIEGFLDKSKISPADVIDQPVTVRVSLARGRVEEFQGKVVFVSSLVQAGGEYQVWAEVDNRKQQRGNLWLLRPGLQAEMTIQLKK